MCLICLCCKGSWWVCIARRRVCQFSVSHKSASSGFAKNCSLGFFCSGSRGGSSVTSSCWAGGSRSHPQSLFPTWDLTPIIMQVCQLLLSVAPFYIKSTHCPGDAHLSCQSGLSCKSWSKCCITTSTLSRKSEKTTFPSSLSRVRIAFLSRYWRGMVKPVVWMYLYHRQGWCR